MVQFNSAFIKQANHIIYAYLNFFGFLQKVGFPSERTCVKALQLHTFSDGTVKPTTFIFSHLSLYHLLESTKCAPFNQFID